MKGLTRDRKKVDSQPTICSKCKAGSGTLVKVDDRYEHQDQEMCGILQMRRKLS